MKWNIVFCMKYKCFSVMQNTRPFNSMYWLLSNSKLHFSF